VARKKKEKPKKQLPPQKCKGCRISFIPKDRRQKFHSSDCRVKYYDTHYASPVVSKTCPNCGTLFQTTKPKKQTYCKPECREENRIKRQDELSSRVKAERLTYLGERFAVLQKYNYACAYCGKSVEQGAVLDVVDDKGELKAACLECRAGREFLGTASSGDAIPHP